MQLEDLERKPIDEPRARKLFTELEFVRLVTDLPRPPPTPPTGARSIATSVEDVQHWFKLWASFGWFCRPC